MVHTAAEAAGKDVQWRQWVAPIALFLLGLMLNSINLDGPPRFDELYHVLGARGYLEHGEPQIAEGVYQRARYFTAVVALLFDAFGESVVVARLPAVVCGALLATIVFVWTRAVAGRVAAWCAAIMLLASPFSTDVFRDVRFYAPQALLFWLGAMAVYAASPERLAAGHRAVLAIGAVLAFAAALYLQPVTLIGLVGIALWLAVSFGLLGFPRLERGARVRILVAVAVTALGLGSAAFSVFGRDLIYAYRWTPLFDTPTRDHFWYYHFWLNLYYPTLWPLFPFAALAAVALRVRPALFCLAVFVPAMALHAFAGRKGLLYVFYAMPFFFVLIGMAFAYLAPRVIAIGHQIVDGALRALGLAPRRWLRIVVTGTAVAFLILANTASVRTGMNLAGITVPPQTPPADWPAAAQQLGSRLRDAAVVLTGDELFALYYLGRYDIMVGGSRMSEMREPVEFTRDPRTGRPVVSTPQSVARIIDCFPSGLFFTDEARWRNKLHIDDAIADVITARAQPLDLPRSSRILAFFWRHAEPGPDPAACADIQGVLGNDIR